MTNKITFTDLQQKWTPEITKRAIELADGYKYYEREMTVGNISVLIKGISCGINSLETTEDFAKAICESSLFPLLLHRAVEGWNKQELINGNYISFGTYAYTLAWGGGLKRGVKPFDFKNYQPCHLTACEMAILDCLCEVLG